MSASMSMSNAEDFLKGYVLHRADDFAVQSQVGKYRRVGRPVSDEDLEDHILGLHTIGSYQTRYPEETCRWIVYDIDDHGEGLAGIQRKLLTESLTEEGVPFYIERSGSAESLHFWLFMEEPVPLDIAYNFARANILYKNRYLISSEIFPKQDCLNPQKPFGNLVKMPLGINQKNGNRSYFEQDISNVETIDLSNWKKVKLPATKVSLKNPVGMSQGERSVGMSTGCKTVKPCIRQIIKSGMQLRHYSGHKLRIAIASDMLRSGYSEYDTAMAFQSQMDFDLDTSLYQVGSLQGYNRPACDSIRRHCKNLQMETGFNIDEVCQKCIHRQEENHGKWGTHRKYINV